MNWHITMGTTLGQTLFFTGMLLLPIGGIVYLLGCERNINRSCVAWSWESYWIGYAILGAGALLLIIGWLVMKKEKIDEPTPSSNA
jgi:hypothetical protein